MRNRISNSNPVNSEIGLIGTGIKSEQNDEKGQNITALLQCLSILGLQLVRVDHSLLSLCLCYFARQFSDISFANTLWLWSSRVYLNLCVECPLSITSFLVSLHTSHNKFDV